MGILCEYLYTVYGLLYFKNENVHVIVYSPESQGVICASVYILTLILFILFAFSDAFFPPTKEKEGLNVNEFPLCRLSVYLSSILSIVMVGILGFLDDVSIFGGDTSCRYRLWRVCRF